MQANFSHIGQPFLAYTNASINCRSKVMNLSFGNMRLELNVFNMCKRPRDKENKDIENEDIKLIEPIIEEHIQDENVTYSIKIYFASSFESSKEFEYNITNIYYILNSTQVPENDSGQLNFEDMIQLEGAKEKKAPKLELKPLPNELKVYIPQRSVNLSSDDFFPSRKGQRK